MRAWAGHGRSQGSVGRGLVVLKSHLCCGGHVSLSDAFARINNCDLCGPMDQGSGTPGRQSNFPALIVAVH